MSQNEAVELPQPSPPESQVEGQGPIDSPELTTPVSEVASQAGSPQVGRTSVGLWVLMGIVILVGGGWLLNLGMHALMDSEADRWIRRFRDHKIVRQELGGIESGGYEWYATFQEPNEETVVYFVRGPQGTAQLVVTEFGMRIPHVELRKDKQTWVLQKGVEDERHPVHE